MSEAARKIHTSPCKGEVAAQSAAGGGPVFSLTPPRRYAPTLPFQGRDKERG